MPPDPAAAPAAPLRLCIDKDALAANWRALDRASGTGKAGAAVKANAYSLGVPQVVPVLRDAGCADWFVAHWQEVPGVMAHVPAGEISVLHGPVTMDEVAFARECGARPVLNTLEQAARWIEGGGGTCDLMIDTGMNRLGVSLKDLGDPLIARLDVDCAMSHMASADEDAPKNAQQLGRFREARASVKARRFSLANSAAIALGPDYHFDLTRPGLSLYGGIPRREMSAFIRQVAFPQAAVLQVRRVMPGETVGYNATFQATREMRVAIVSVGYADGYLRAWSDKGRFSFEGAALPAIGRVSMDMTAVDVSDVPTLREGDWLGIEYDPVWASRTSGLSQYEIFTVLGSRFSRR
ncbi:alanine racemase [Novosphingobium sp. ZN18A2]|uniref:alanine racemase n=1 Tax=Novosphingobium sp. ZN18A2 TaxID=3079861 RepID=UPI0030D006B9